MTWIGEMRIKFRWNETSWISFVVTSNLSNCKTETTRKNRADDDDHSQLNQQSRKVAAKIKPNAFTRWCFSHFWHVWWCSWWMRPVCFRRPTRPTEAPRKCKLCSQRPFGKSPETCWCRSLPIKWDVIFKLIYWTSVWNWMHNLTTFEYWNRQ